MAGLQDAVIAAHGGARRWSGVSMVRAHLLNGGAIWALKEQDGVLDDCSVKADLHRQFVSHAPFGAPALHSVFTGGYVAVEDEADRVLQDRRRPKESFAGHARWTPWDRLQLAYFAGEAMWTYLTVPFCFAMPGFASEEIGPWTERGETWQRLKVTFPPDVATHCAEQIFHFGDDGLMRRHDYTVDILDASPAVQYMSEYEEIDGIMVPTRRRVFPAGAEGGSTGEPSLVSIDLERVTFA
jgi:hypothetical protein